MSRSEDKTIKVWVLLFGKEERTLSGHTKGVHAVAVISDGSRLVSGSEDRTCAVWDVLSSGSLLLSLGYCSPVVKCVLLSEDSLAPSLLRNSTASPSDT